MRSLICFLFTICSLLSRHKKTSVQEIPETVRFSPEEKKQKKIEEALYESEQRFHLVAENLPKGLVVIDKNATITFVNVQITQMLGYSADEIVGRKLSDYIESGSRQIIEGGLLKTAPALIDEYELDFFNKDGTKTSTITQLTSLFDQEKRNIGILIEVQHVSTGRKIEYRLHEKLSRLQKSELATLNIMEDLQDTIKDLERAKAEINQKNEALGLMNRELNLARDELALLNHDLERKVKERTTEVETLLRQKDDFINQLGHDLKTPLTPLNALLPIIKKRENDPKVNELLDICISNVNFMRNLVVRTLELARLNSPSTVLSLDDVCLAEEVNEILRTKQSMFEDNNVTVTNNVPEALVVRADSMQIKELFDNIIVNAVKYTTPLEHPRITIDAREQGADIIVSIADTGIGLSSEQLENIFHEFFKADSSRHHLDSTGLGLSICKRIVQKHGGRIWAESPGLGKGSTFYFSLPIIKKKTI